MSYFDFVAIIELLSVGLLVITVSVAAGQYLCLQFQGPDHAGVKF